ncbi:hypothetical protein ABPG74_002664 [Tetrahymena malaccensis]
MIEILIIFSISVALTFGYPGFLVDCNEETINDFSCGPAAGGRQEAIASKARIVDCDDVNYSQAFFIYDTLCKSCPPKEAIGSAFATSNQKSCAYFSESVGIAIPCGGQVNNCSTCGNPPTGFSWKVVNTQLCQISSCLAAPFPYSGLTDNFCESCGKAYKYVNIQGSYCLNSSKSCINRDTISDPWTDTDCKACYSFRGNSQKIFASTDGQSCVSSTKSCKNRNTTSDPWSETDCNVCNLGSANSSKMFASTDGFSCSCVSSTKSCKNRNSTSDPWSDSDCNSCNLGGSYSLYIFASSDELSCVSSTKSCKNRNTTSDPWTDNDCNACNSDRAIPTSQFASMNGMSCVRSAKSCKNRNNTSDPWTDDDCRKCNSDGTDSSKIFASVDFKSCVASKATCNRSSN